MHSLMRSAHRSFVSEKLSSRAAGKLKSLFKEAPATTTVAAAPLAHLGHQAPA